MKKVLTGIAAAAMLVGCSSKPAESPKPTAEATAEPTAEVTEASGVLKVGIGSASSVEANAPEAEKDGSATINTTFAGIVLDENNTIKYLYLDAAQNGGTWNAEGAITSDPAAETPTKKEMGEAYGMKAVSEKVGIGKEWFEQAEGFEAWATGKTLDEVLGTGVEEGIATDADLLTTTTVHISDFLAAVQAAADNAVEVEGAAQFGVGSSTSLSTAEATSEAEGKVQVSVTYGIFAADEAGKVVFAQTDCAENSAAFDATGAVTKAEAIPTKCEFKEDYGMKAVSEKVGIGKEWYEQAAGFDAWCVGKTLADIAGTTEDADLLTTTTVHIDGFTGAAGAAKLVTVK